MSFHLKFTLEFIFVFCHFAFLFDSDSRDMDRKCRDTEREREMVSKQCIYMVCVLTTRPPDNDNL